MQRKTVLRVYGQTLGRMFNISLGTDILVFQTTLYTFLVCVYGVQKIITSEKYISICSDRQAAFKALQAAQTYPLVQQ